MLTGAHFLLSYKCDSECDHCFLYSGPRAKGTFTLAQIRKALGELVKIGTIEWVYFEGGEPFLFYPIMLEGIRLARDKGFKTGVVTNSYFATDEGDAELWLGPLKDLGLSNLSVSDDPFHFDEKDARPKTILSAARRLGIPTGPICIERPRVDAEARKADGGEVVGGGALLKGRAVDKLVEGLPRRDPDEFRRCPEEDLRAPKRVHLDAYGHVHLCQGLTMGNMWATPLSEIVRSYRGEDHPICGPLLDGGPALLAQRYQVPLEEGYVTACHFCYKVRLALLDRFPQYLAPRQVYGLE
jgi:hypothetical protein